MEKSHDNEDNSYLLENRAHSFKESTETDRSDVRAYGKSFYHDESDAKICIASVTNGSDNAKGSEKRVGSIGNRTEYMNAKTSVTLDALLKVSRDHDICVWSEGTDSTSLRGDSFKKHSEHSINPIVVFTSHAYGNYDGSH